MKYKYESGLFAPTSCLRSILTNKSYFAPKQNQVYSEELLFGISGGIGIGYILWNYKTKNRIQLSLHFHNHWGKEIRTMVDLCRRLGLEITIADTTSSRKAYNNLRVLLDKGELVIVWVDRNKLPYNFEPLDKHEKTPHPIVITAFDKENNTVTVADMAKDAFQISMDDLIKARRNIPSLKNCLVQVKNYTPAEHLSTIVTAGIYDVIEKLGTTSQSFSLPALKKWTKLLISDANQKSWSTIFADSTDLFTVLAKIFENTVLYAGDGHALRHLYADFLAEAKNILQLPELDEIAGLYRKAGDQWVDFAHTAFSDEIKLFKMAKQLLSQKHTALKELGFTSAATLKTSAGQLQEIYQECSDAFPLNGKQVTELFHNMADKLFQVHNTELQALHLLAQTMDTANTAALRV